MILPTNYNTDDEKVVENSTNDKLDIYTCNDDKDKQQHEDSNYQILQRDLVQTQSEINDDYDKIIYPTLPYHKRWENYVVRRNAIFENHLVAQIQLKPTKRSTRRLRNFYKRLKMCKKFLVSAIVSNSTDNRYYAKVSFLDITEYGLLDTGASISCVGSDLARVDFSKFSNFTRCKTHVKTADGNAQQVIGWINVDITFKDIIRNLNLFIIPSLSQRLILGIDFWKNFNLMPNVIESVDIVHKSILSISHSKSCIPTDEAPCSIENDKIYNSNDSEEHPYSLTSSQRLQLNTIISLFPDFQKEGLGRTSLIQHEIDVGEAKPIKQRFYPVSPAVEKLMYDEIDRMLALGVIEKSSSPWSSPMRLVIKPNKVRLCLDARKVNAVTLKDAYPLPSIEGIFARLPKANIISKLDLKDAYWQIGLADASRPLTAFTVPGRPLYQFVVMPFGLCNAPQTMSRLMDEIIPPELKNCVFGYLDDLIIVSENFSEHLLVLVRIAEQFRKANLTINVAKCHFCVTRVKYLGYVIGDGGISTDPEKVSSIKDWPIPKTVRQVRGFLGLAGWYRRFIENFSSIVFHISETISKKRKFDWTPEAQAAFDKIKMCLSTAPVLTNPDFFKEILLTLRRQ